MHVSHVFITHGHLDHCGTIVSHARLRALSRGPPAKYYMGAELAKGMQKVQIDPRKLGVLWIEYRILVYGMEKVKGSNMAVKRV